MSHLNDYSAIISIPIQWGDQDAFGHVNNTVPIRWFESSRIAFLDACGLGEMMTGEGVGPILAAVTPAITANKFASPTLSTSALARQTLVVPA